MRKLAIIGGSGVYSLDGRDSIKKVIVRTPYGDVECMHGTVQGNEVTFITRHGANHSVPPHLVNYRANIFALKKMGVEEIMATAAVGSLNKLMRAGDFVVCDQLLDFTKSRVNTFFDGVNYPVGHVDFTYPYCESLRRMLQKCMTDMEIRFHSEGTMIVTEGPRFESAAEIKMYAHFGGDVVGMTNAPECVLAREAQMHYACVAIVTNMAAGISKTLLSHEEVLAEMKQSGDKMSALIDRFITFDGAEEKSCHCDTAMKEFGGFRV